MGVTLEKFSLVIFAFIFQSLFVSGIVINEFYAAGSGEEDDDDWIELFNPFDFPVDIESWSINDSSAPSLVHEFEESTVIPAGGYLTIGVEDRLNAGGETITLLDEFLSVVDGVTYGASAPVPGTDESTGRFPNGEDTDIDENDFSLFHESAISKGSENICPIYNSEQDKCYGLSGADDSIEELGEEETITLFGNPIDPDSLVTDELSDEGSSELASNNVNIEISADANGKAFALLAEYSQNPGTPNPMFGAGSSFFEVFLNITDPTIHSADITFCGISGILMLFYDKVAETWVVASDQEIIDCGGGVQGILVFVDDSTVPNLAQLSQDPPFGGGSPVGVPALGSFGLVVLVFILGVLGYFWKR